MTVVLMEEESVMTQPHHPRHDYDARAENNLLVLVGQLLEANKATTEVVKSLSADVKQHSHAMVTMVHTVEALERSYAKLDRIIHTGDNPVLQRIAEQANLLSHMREAIDDLHEAADETRRQVDEIGDHRREFVGAWKVICLIAGAVVAVLTVAAGFYTAGAAGK